MSPLYMSRYVSRYLQICICIVDMYLMYMSTYVSTYLQVCICIVDMYLLYMSRYVSTYLQICICIVGMYLYSRNVSWRYVSFKKKKNRTTGVVFSPKFIHTTHMHNDRSPRKPLFWRFRGPKTDTITDFDIRKFLMKTIKGAFCLMHYVAYMEKVKIYKQKKDISSLCFMT